MKTIPSILALLALMLITTNGEPLAIDSKAPDLTLNDSTGASQSLAGYLKKGPVALVFYRSGNWWPPCKKQLVELQKSEAAIKAIGAQIVAISFDDVETLKKVKETLKLSYPLLSDPRSQTIEAYGIRNEKAAGSRIDGVPHPTTFIIGTDGIVKASLAYKGHSKRHGGADILKALQEAAEK